MNKKPSVRLQMGKRESEQRKCTGKTKKRLLIPIKDARTKSALLSIFLIQFQ